MLACHNRAEDWKLKGCKLETHSWRIQSAGSLSKTFYPLFDNGSTHEIDLTLLKVLTRQ